MYIKKLGMKDFRLFDISDFVMDEDFIRWVNEKSKADNDFWNNWLKQYPEKHMAVAEARQILESIGTEQNVINEDEVQYEVDRLLQTIKAQPELTAHPRPLVLITRKWWYAAAAVLVITGAATIKYIFSERKASAKFTYTALTSSRHLVEQVNTSDKPIILTLSDGSVIELAVKSSVSYLNNFDSADTRDVFLSGEAFFKVAKISNRPFRVFANEIVAKVLGTSFIVRSFEKDSTIQVMVKTGKVGIYSQALRNTKETIGRDQIGDIILTSNQQLVYEKEAQKFQKVLLEYPVIINSTISVPDIVFEDAPLEQVFDQISKAYGINIVYDDELLKNCTVTADLRNESFYRKLDLICSAIGASYKVIDGQVVIQSGECQ